MSTWGVTVIRPTTLPMTQGSPGSEETLPTDGVSRPPGSTVPPQFSQGERFLPIRPHARGGIGQVWLARDRELQREVALKVIQPRYAERDDQRARFLLEAEITGNLEHPGIVPVYSLGRNSEGRPFYAMRFIRGESFSLRRSDSSTCVVNGRAGAAGRRCGGSSFDSCSAGSSTSATRWITRTAGACCIGT